MPMSVPTCPVPLEGGQLLERPLGSHRVPYSARHLQDQVLGGIAEALAKCDPRRG